MIENAQVDLAGSKLHRSIMEAQETQQAVFRMWMIVTMRFIALPMACLRLVNLCMDSMMASTVRFVILPMQTTRKYEPHALNVADYCLHLVGVDSPGAMLVASSAPACLLEYKDLHMLRMNRAPVKIPRPALPSLWSGQKQGTGDLWSCLKTRLAGDGQAVAPASIKY